MLKPQNHGVLLNARSHIQALLSPNEAVLEVV